MVKSEAQLLGQAAKMAKVNLQEKLETNFSSAAAEVAETSIVEKISERLNVNVRFSRLKKRVRSRSSNIL